MTLVEKQEAMRSRQKPRTGRPLRQPEIPLERQLEGSRKFLAYLALERGETFAVVAARYGFRIDALIEWFRWSKRL